MNEDEVVQLHELNKVWPKLSRRQRDGILVMAGVIALPRDPHGSHHPSRRDPRLALPRTECPEGFDGELSDREIAKKVGVAHSTLVKNKTYMRSKRVYFQEIRHIVRVGHNIGKLRIQKE